VKGTVEHLRFRPQGVVAAVVIAVVVTRLSGRAIEHDLDALTV
jgi:hypothetical protein